MPAGESQRCGPMKKTVPVLPFVPVRRDESRKEGDGVKKRQYAAARQRQPLPPQSPPENTPRRLHRGRFGEYFGIGYKRRGVHYFNRIRGSLHASSRSATKFPATSRPAAITTLSTTSG